MAFYRNRTSPFVMPFQGTSSVGFSTQGGALGCGLPGPLALSLCAAREALNTYSPLGEKESRHDVH